MNHSSAASRTFLARANDLECRDFSVRLSRFIRARFRSVCERARLFADNPRVWTAWKRGWEAEHYARLLRWRDGGFRPAIIYDIGAHEGCWSEMAQAVFAPHDIFLFEPQQEFQRKATSRQPATGAQWTMMPFALGDKEASSAMNITENSAASSLLEPAKEVAAWGLAPVRQDQIQVMPLDHLAVSKQLPPPDLVKIDVQGYEHRVIEGGKETLAQARRIVIEVSLQTIYEDQAQLPEVLQSLSALGFTLEDMNEGARLWPSPPAQMDLWLRRGA